VHIEGTSKLVSIDCSPFLTFTLIGEPIEEENGLKIHSIAKLYHRSDLDIVQHVGCVSFNIYQRGSQESRKWLDLSSE
jgi:hypothetical protein